MSGTWAVLWPSGKTYGFYRTHAEAASAAAYATSFQCALMKVVLWA